MMDIMQIMGSMELMESIKSMESMKLMKLMKLMESMNLMELMESMNIQGDIHGKMSHRCQIILPLIRDRPYTYRFTIGNITWLLSLWDL